ncbi:MAG: SurA N-terminal domain-containing protein [Bacteroidota bacterium]
MSVLEKIRSRSGLLLGVIAVALLVFILQSAFESGSSFFSGDKDKVGEVAGEKIAYQEFDFRVQQAIDSEKQRQQKNAIDDNTMDQLRQQTWNQIVFERIMLKEYEKVGVNVSTDELYDMVAGKDPHPSVRQSFTDPQTGQFNPANVINFLNQMNQDQTGQSKAQWLNFEASIKKERLGNKYNNLIKGGLYATKNDAKNDYIAKNSIANFSFVAQRYAGIPDTDVKVTDEDIQKYYNENKNKYKQPENARSVDYVTWDVTPSAEDIKQAEAAILALKEEFATAKNDTQYVNANSDKKFEAAFQKKGVMPAMLDSILFNAPAGTVYGPYLEGTTYKLAKLTASKNAPDSVKARHILISVIAGKSDLAKKTADSLKALITSKKAKFEDLAKIASQDKGSAEKGGDLGWFAEGAMVKPFNDACFNGKKGDITIVESQFGIHLIELMDRSSESKKALVCYIEKQVMPSSATIQTYYAKASEFAGKNPTQAAFEKSIVDLGMNKRVADYVREADRTLMGLENSREVVRWAFTAERGKISPVFELGNVYLIAVLRDIRDKGIMPLESIKPMLQAEAIKEKKAEKFIAAMNGATSIEALATKLNTGLEKVEAQTFAASSVPNMGREPELVGAVFGNKPNMVSKPIKGFNGVYVVKVNSVTAPAAITDFKQIQAQIMQANKSRVDYELFEALKEKANVVDNRGKFF